MGGVFKLLLRYGRAVWVSSFGVAGPVTRYWR